LVNWKKGSAAEKWIPVLNAAEVHYSVPENLAARQCFEESRFNPEARNAKSGCIGLMQLLSKAFPGAGASPLKDIDTGVSYLAHLYMMFSDWQLALAAYNWGPGNLKKALKRSGFGLARLPPETQKYVTQIIEDVPVPGILCKTQNLQNSHQSGFQVNPSSEGTRSAASLLSFWSRLSFHFIPKESTTTQSPLPFLASVPSSRVTLFQTENQGVNQMSNENPVLLAAAPTLVEGIGLLQTALNTILTGDPAQIALRAGPAAAIFIGQVELLLPQLASAEVGAVNTEAQAKLSALATKLEALATPAATAATPEVSTAATKAV
jgi:Transglycosylase SLT domain